MTDPASAWAASLVLTLAVELPVCAWSLRQAPRARVLAAAVLATLLTHPAFWFALPHLFQDYWTYIVVGELTIVAVETAVLALAIPISPRRALVASAWMNGASYLVGLGWSALLGS